MMDKDDLHEVFAIAKEAREQGEKEGHRAACEAIAERIKKLESDRYTGLDLAIRELYQEIRAFGQTGKWPE